MQKILGREIRRAIIVDDDPSARDAYAYPIEELNLQPVKIPRLHDPKSFIKDLSPSEDVVVCDYHLKMHDYAKCNGDAFMAACYEANIPGVLSSTLTRVRHDFLVGSMIPFSSRIHFSQAFVNFCGCSSEGSRRTGMLLR